MGKSDDGQRGAVDVKLPDAVVHWPIDRLILYERNPRTHSRGQIERIAASMREFGFTNPILVDGNAGIVAGHGRLEAAKLIGLSVVPVIELTHLTPEQRRAYVIADNRLALDAGWDDALLVEELRALDGFDFDMSVLGFDDAELAGLLEVPETVEVASPEPPDVPVTQVGDLWMLGEHRLLCGDSAKAEDVDRLLAGAPVHLVNSDPPYNVNVEPRTNNAIAAGTSSWVPEAKKRAHLQGFDMARQGRKRATGPMRPKDRPLQNDFMPDEEFARCLDAWFGNMARVLIPGGAFYVWGGYANWKNYCAAMQRAELYFSQGITWVKNHPVLGRKDFLNDCEHAWYGWKAGGAHRWLGPHNISNVWVVKKVSAQSMIHITEKPIELAARAIRYSSRPEENVLDLFGGSGSTLIAAEQCNRRAFLMELDPAYTDVIVTRWQDATGQSATLEEGGKPFGAMRAERVVEENRS